MKRNHARAVFGAVALTSVFAGTTVSAQEPFIGEINNFGMPHCPKGWAPAAGQLLPINQNQALFSLLGTTYGGDGQVTFALPDLRGRVVVAPGPGLGLSPYALGETGGSESVTLTTNELPLHAHLVPDLGVPPTVRVKSSNGPLASVETTAVGATEDS